MPSRVVALAALAIAVLTAGVYLVHAVNETSVVAAAAVSARHEAHGAGDESAQPVSSPHVEHAAAQAAPSPELGTGGDVTADDIDDSALGSSSATGQPNPKLEAIMDLANKAYDRQDYEEAKAIAGKVLAKQPKSTRMMRIMVSSACLEGDAPAAQKWYEQLPKPDRFQMKVRCDRNGVALTEPQGG